MTKHAKYRLSAAGALLAIWCAACKQQAAPCLQPTEVHLVVETMHKTTDTATIFSDTSLTAARFTSLSATQQHITFIFGSSSLFHLSLSPNDTLVQWALTNDSAGAVIDTISIRYQPSRQFLSNACGYTFFYSLNAVSSTHKIIDSVRLNNKNVNNNVSNDPRHIQVYIHPDY